MQSQIKEALPPEAAEQISSLSTRLIIALDDEDLRHLVDGRNQSGTSFRLLRDRFDGLIL